MPTTAEVKATAGRLYDRGDRTAGALAAALGSAVPGIGPLVASSVAAATVQAKAIDRKTGNNPLIPDAIEAPADAAVTVAQTGGAVLGWLTEPGAWLRISYAMIGGGMVLIGLAVMVRGQASGLVGKVAGVAGVVAPTGKVAKVAGTVSRATKAAGG